MSLTNTHVLCSMSIILIIHLNLYLLQRKSGLSYEIIDL